MNFDALAQKAGVIYMGQSPQLLTPQTMSKVAMDAQSVAITSPSAGVASVFTTWVQPKPVEILLTPTPLAEALGEVKKGDWVSQTILFATVESSGEVASYGDFNENGLADANVNYPERNPYHYQSIIRVGDREAAIAGAANLNWTERKQIASVTALNRFQNLSYIFGVNGLKNYGLINDPSLLPSITSPTWTPLSALEVYNKFWALFAQLVKQTEGLVTDNSKMTLIYPPSLNSNLNKTNDFGFTVKKLLADNFPNLKLVVVPEYATNAGQQVQLIADAEDGQPTVELSFTEKMRVFPIDIMKSGFEQKRMQGTNGAIVYRPFMIAGMLVANDAP